MGGGRGVGVVGAGRGSERVAAGVGEAFHHLSYHSSREQVSPRQRIPGRGPG